MGAPGMMLPEAVLMQNVAPSTNVVRVGCPSVTGGVPVNAQDSVTPTPS
jgi:hypothetical protein